MKFLQLRPHQKKALNSCKKVLAAHGKVYLAGEVRTGKTLVALHLAAASKLPTLFITKKMAIESIHSQVVNSGLDLKIHITNYEQLHNIIPGVWRFIIVDEAHTLGMYPKPARRARLLRLLTNNCPVVLLSGTPSPESYSQLFNQLWAVNSSLWARYRNFYAWARDYVHVEKMYFGGVPVNDYSQANMLMINRDIRSIVVSMTQQDAGFVGLVHDRIHTIELAPGTKEAIKAVMDTGVYGPLGLEALSASQRMAYVHQLCSGTVISGEDRLVVDYSKVDYIAKNWRRKRKAIFYCYVAEGDLLRKWFPNCTSSPEEFHENPKLDFICQIKSGQEGTDLSAADVIIFYNISYSASSYFQGRARGQHQQAPDMEVHWLFSDNGFERDVFNLITGDNGKKRYTTSHFRGFVESVGNKKTSLRRLASY